MKADTQPDPQPDPEPDPDPDPEPAPDPDPNQVGPDFPLALDCYMALSVPYAIRLGHALAPYGLKWLEEFLQPDDYEGYAEVRRALGGT